MAVNTAKKSILVNLRGFIVNSYYALDYSDVHQLNEGLCFMFRSTPTVYFPYLSVNDCFVHFEPYRVKLQYNYNSQNLQQLNAMNNVRAREILKRGYDQFVYDDILVWVVLQLNNNVKLWLPLSATQLQSDSFASSSLFGFTGNEVASVIQMIRSQLVNICDDEEQLMKQQNKMDKIADFCRLYQKQRVESSAEEALHIQQFDRVFVPVTDE